MLNKSTEKIEAMKGIPNERPLMPVKDLFQVNLQDRVGIFAFHFLEVGNVLLVNNSIIRSSLVRH